MPNYRRAFIPGGTWFFTVNLLQRHGNDLLVREIDLLRASVRHVKRRYRLGCVTGTSALRIDIAPRRQRFQLTLAFDKK